MRRIVGALGLVWALAHLLLAYLFVTNAFIAKTVAKEGLLAQVSLLLGGLAIAVWALMLLWQCYRLLAGSPAGSAGMSEGTRASQSS